MDFIKPERAGSGDDSSYIIVNDGLEHNDTPLIAQLKERILKSEFEVKELLDQLYSENK